MNPIYQLHLSIDFHNVTAVFCFIIVVFVALTLKQLLKRTDTTKLNEKESYKLCIKPMDSSLHVEPTTAAVSTPEIIAGNAFFYYEDLARAERFYEAVLGLRKVRTYGDFAVMFQIGAGAFLTLVDAARGRHKATEPRTAAIALLTNEIDGWWEYARSHPEINLKTTDFKPVSGSAHDSFVVIDPEGYFVEIERFNAHPENVSLMNLLATLPEFETSHSDESRKLAFRGSVLWFYYRDLNEAQRYYESVLKLPLIVDQGWAKLYPLGPFGSIFGIVSEVEGMHKFTPTKAVTLSIVTLDINTFYQSMKSIAESRVCATPRREGDHIEFLMLDPADYDIEVDEFDLPLSG